MRSPGGQATARRWLGVMTEVRSGLKRDRVSLSAGSLAYHWFLALFPAVVVALGCIALAHVTPATVRTFTRGIDKALPRGVSSVFSTAVKAAGRRTTGSAVAVAVGVVVALVSASGAMAALQQALDMAYGVTKDRTFVARRVRAIPLMAATGLFGGIAAALIVFAQPLGSLLQHHLSIHGTAFVAAWTVVRWVATILVVLVLFSIYYFVGPNRPDRRWQWASPGGLVGTAIFLLASLGFSFYVSEFGSYGATYGSFAGVAILIFWLYLTGFAVLLGAEINAAVEASASTAPVEASASTAPVEGGARAAPVEGAASTAPVEAMPARGERC